MTDLELTTLMKAQSDVKLSTFFRFVTSEVLNRGLLNKTYHNLAVSISKNAETNALRKTQGLTHLGTEPPKE